MPNENCKNLITNRGDCQAAIDSFGMAERSSMVMQAPPSKLDRLRNTTDTVLHPDPVGMK
jgi:hypothetical protein